MPKNLTGLEISLGLKDKAPTAWNGSSRFPRAGCWRWTSSAATPRPKVQGKQFRLRTFQWQQQMRATLIHPVLRVNLAAPPGAEVTLQTEQGKFSFKLSELAQGETRKFLNGNVAVERQEGVVRLTGPKTEDDYPALAAGRDGSAWLAYLEYPARPARGRRAERTRPATSTCWFPRITATRFCSCISTVRPGNRRWRSPARIFSPGGPRSRWTARAAWSSPGASC